VPSQQITCKLVSTDSATDHRFSNWGLEDTLRSRAAEIQTAKMSLVC